MANKREIIIFIIIIALATFFRLYKIDSIPSGLYPDEAMNGNNALEALDTGEFKVFYSENNGREGLFINIQSLSLAVFKPKIWSLRIVSALFGILTVAGLYLLTKELFGWRQAALASVLMSISSWHVIFSRIGFRAIMVPFILVFGFYFFWKGLKKSDLLSFGLAGLFLGLGTHTYISFRIAPLIILVTLFFYWLGIRNDFNFLKYRYVKEKLISGLVVFIAMSVLIALPIIIYFAQNQNDFLNRTTDNLSVFSQDKPIKELGLSTIKTLGMFNFVGDYNWRHNISGWPQLSLPIGLLFFFGFFRELAHTFRRKHGHISTPHIFLFAWFFIMLLPGFLSTEAPHALRTIGVIPVVMIFSAQGLFWLFEKLYRWDLNVDPHADKNWSRRLVVITLFVFIISVSFLEYYRYFKVWGESPETANAFNQKYTELAYKLNNLAPEMKNMTKYVLVNTSGVLVRGIPMPAQTIMFLTDTFTPQKQAAKDLFYVTQEQYDSGYCNDANSIIFPLIDVRN